jgi:hypothetical protein
MENLRLERNTDVVDTEGLLERLKSEHQALEKRLSELNSHIYLTPEEQVEKKRIQKLKLAKKDQIQHLLHTRTGNA